MSISGTKRGDGRHNKGPICTYQDPVYGSRSKPVVLKCECGKRIRNSRNTMCTKCSDTLEGLDNG